MADIREIGNGRYTNGTNQFVKSSCEFCKQDFFARKDRQGKNRFCNQQCYWNQIEEQNTFVLSKYQQDTINGCLLSDACITKTKKAKNFLFSHTSIHESYSDFLIEELKIPLHKNSKAGGVQTIIGRQCNCSSSFEIRSPNSPTFTKLRSRWYQEKKIIPRDIDINEICLLHWYLGDGTINPSRGITFCTDAFSTEDNDFLISKLNKIDLCARIEDRNRIHIPNKRVCEFFQFIGPPPLECFAYKWDSPIKESYLNRKCKECETSFDAEINSRYFCSHKCYLKHWRRNGPTLRTTCRKEDGEEVQGCVA